MTRRGTRLSLRAPELDYQAYPNDIVWRVLMTNLDCRFSHSTGVKTLIRAGVGPGTPAAVWRQLTSELLAPLLGLDGLVHNEIKSSHPFRLQYPRKSCCRGWSLQQLQLTHSTSSDAAYHTAWSGLTFDQPLDLRTQSPGRDGSHSMPRRFAGARLPTSIVSSATRMSTSRSLTSLTLTKV